VRPPRPGLRWQIIWSYATGPAGNREIAFVLVGLAVGGYINHSSTYPDVAGSMSVVVRHNIVLYLRNMRLLRVAACSQNRPCHCPCQTAAIAANRPPWPCGLR
jgi:hypothetical protein